MSVRLCSMSDLDGRQPVRIELETIDIAVVRSGDEIFAIEDLCSHAEFPLSDGDVEGCTVECVLHGSRFDLRTGRPTGPPATASVAVFEVSVVDGDVYIELESQAS